MNRATHDYNNAFMIDFTPKSLIVHVTEVVAKPTIGGVNVFYNLAQDLSVQGFETGDLFETTHAQMYAERKLDHALMQGELEVFRNPTFLSRREPKSLLIKADR